MNTVSPTSSPLSLSLTLHSPPPPVETDLSPTANTYYSIDSSKSGRVITPKGASLTTFCCEYLGPNFRSRNSTNIYRQESSFALFTYFE